MKKITITEANQNFSDAIKTVDQTGEIAITKRGKEKYVLMTIEKYEGREKFEDIISKKLKKGFWTKYNDWYWHLKETNGKITITRLEFRGNELEYYKIIEADKSEITITEGEPIVVEIGRRVNIEFCEIWSKDNPQIRKLEEDLKTAEITEAKFTGFKMAII